MWLWLLVPSGLSAFVCYCCIVRIVAIALSYFCTFSWNLLLLTSFCLFPCVCSPCSMFVLVTIVLYSFLLEDTKEWSPVKDRTTSCCASPGARYGHTCVMDSRKMYLFGGSVTDNNLYAYDFGNCCLFRIQHYCPRPFLSHSQLYIFPRASLLTLALLFSLNVPYSLFFSVSPSLFSISLFFSSCPSFAPVLPTAPFQLSLSTSFSSVSF